MKADGGEPVERRPPGAGRWNQRALHAAAREGYLHLDWPEPVQVASKGYLGSGGACRFVWRTSLELLAFLGAFPGLNHWTARGVRYVGRSDSGFIAIQPRPLWNLVRPPVREVWRTPLGTAVVTARTFGHYTVVDFGGHPVWLITADLESLLWRWAK